MTEDGGMTSDKRDLAMMFTGGTDTTLAAARILEDDKYARLHLLTFCNGICVKVESSRIHADELIEKHGPDRIHHEITYVTELFKRIRSPVGALIRKYNSTLVFDLCCRLSMETAAIIYALDNGICEICDGTNIDQGRLFLERPEYLRVSKAYFASFGLRYFSPVYGMSGGRIGRRDELVRRGFTVGPKFLERLNITSCLFTQPFCLMAFHTYFFTSFARKLPLLRSLIARHTLSLDAAIELRLDRQEVARRLVEEHLAFNAPGANDDGLRIQDHFCTTRLCGKNAVEIAFPRGTVIDINALAAAWADEGKVTRDGGLARLDVDGLQVEAHPNGRVLVTGTRNRDRAVALFRRVVAPADVFST